MQRAGAVLAETVGRVGPGGVDVDRGRVDELDGADGGTGVTVVGTGRGLNVRVVDGGTNEGELVVAATDVEVAGDVSVGTAP